MIIKCPVCKDEKRHILYKNSQSIKCEDCGQKFQYNLILKGKTKYKKYKGKGE